MKSKGLDAKVKKSLLRKALAVSPDQGDSDLSYYLPAPLASEVIEYIRDICLVRRLINVFSQSVRTWKKPKRTSGNGAYYIPDGVRAVETGFATSSVSWVAKKLMTNTLVDEETIEDSQPDVINQLLRDFAQAFAEAEDYAFLQGDTTHAATAPDVASASANNWFVRDPRLMFDGIFTVAGSGSAASGVNCNGQVYDVDQINLGLYNLGKYGRVKNRIIALLPTDQAANMRGNSDLKQFQITGVSASFLNPSLSGSAGEGDSVIGTIYGVKHYEAPFAPAGQIALLHRDSPEIGDRRMIKLANEMIIEADQRRYVGSERISFNFNYPDALCLLSNLSQTIVS